MSYTSPLTVLEVAFLHRVLSLSLFAAEPPLQVHLGSVPAPGAVRFAGGRVVHLEGVDAVAAPDRLTCQGSNDGAAAAQDASQEGQVRTTRMTGKVARNCPFPGFAVLEQSESK